MDYQERLSQEFRDVYWLMHRYHQSESWKEDGALDPHQGQGRILLLLQKAKELSQRDLCSILDVRSQSVGEMLKKLEKNGYITRTPSEEDRRVMILHLTEKGAAARVAEVSFEGIFECLKEEEQETLLVYLEKIRKTLAGKMGTGSERTVERRWDEHGRPEGKERSILADRGPRYESNRTYGAPYDFRDDRQFDL